MKLTSFVLIGALAVSGYAQAQTQAQTPARTGGAMDQSQINAACKEAAKRLCAGKQGRDAIDCLKSHSDKIPQKCKDAISK